METQLWRAGKGTPPVDMCSGPFLGACIDFTYAAVLARLASACPSPSNTDSLLLQAPQRARGADMAEVNWAMMPPTPPASPPGGCSVSASRPPSPAKAHRVWHGRAGNHAPLRGESPEVRQRQNTPAGLYIGPCVWSVVALAVSREAETLGGGGCSERQPKESAGVGF